jgi:hypothetical protein
MSQTENHSVGESAASGASSGGRRFGRGTGLGVGAVVLIGLAAAFFTWFLVVRPEDDTSAVPFTPATAAPEIATLADLRTLADSGETFYWAGTRSGTRIELTAPDGTVYLRYLPPGESAGSAAPALTVATYPRSDAFEEVRRAAEGEDVTTLDLARGGLAVVDRSSDTNVHLAYPDEPYQIEVYAPEPGLARRLVASGTVRPY